MPSEQDVPIADHLRQRRWFVRLAQQAEFRLTVLACAIWLLLVHIYRPWENQFYEPWKRNKSLFAEDAAFFFWRLGFDAVGNNPWAVIVGLSIIAVLLYMVGWVVRGLITVGGHPPQPQTSTLVGDESNGKRSRNRVDGTGRAQAGSPRPESSLSQWLSASGRVWAIFCVLCLVSGVVVGKYLIRAVYRAAPREIGMAASWLARTSSGALVNGLPPDTLPADFFETSRNTPTIETRTDDLDTFIAGLSPEDEDQSGKRPNIRNETGNKEVQSTGMTKSPSSTFHSVPPLIGSGEVPCTFETDLEAVRPKNGAESELKSIRPGYGKMTITNGNSEDSAIILADLAGEQDDRLMHIRNGMQATMTGIAAGRYRIRFQIGTNWDERTETFQCVTSTAEFENTETFTEEDRTDGIEYSHLRLTLHKAVGGNARSRSIPQQTFVRRRAQK